MAFGLAETDKFCQVSFKLGSKVCPNRYDYLCFLRTLFVGVCAALLCLIVALSTDNAANSIANQAARMAVLSPALGALALLISNSQAKMRGESQALATCGISPLRACAGSLAAAVSLGLAGAAAVFVFAPPLSPLFPQLDIPLWTMLSENTWRNSEGLLVSAQRLDFLPPFQAAAKHTHDRLPVSTLVALLAIAVPLWLSYPVSIKLRLPFASFAIVGLLFSFHLVAANMLSAWALLAGPMLIAFHTVFLGIQSRK